MYNKFLIVASKKDKAGTNITTALSQFGNFNFYLPEEEIIHTENLNREKINQYDFIIFASKHASEKKEKTLSIHAPGNFSEAKFGGSTGKVCKSSAQFQKQLFQKLKQKSEEHELNNYNITLEATHHGPLIDKPCVFIEIGSTDVEWRDKRAAFVIAKTISETLENFRENPYYEIGIGVGGPHYCPCFNKLQMESNVAISHVIPKYVKPLTESMLIEAWNKTEEEPDFFVVDWKGLGKSEERKDVIEVIEKLKLPWKKISEIKR